jgi:hypothetical protein
MSNSSQANPIRLQNNKYFSPSYPDQYTVLGYWRRRYCSDSQYLLCYHYPWGDHRFYPSGYLATGKETPCSANGRPGVCIGWVDPRGNVGGAYARSKCGKQCFILAQN